MSVSIHEHEAVVAERDALRQQLDELAATANKWASAYAEKDADVERLYRVIDANWVNHKQIVVNQLRVKQLREATEGLLHLCEIIGAPEGAVLDKARHALATPTDTAAIEAMIAKAGEVMRERAVVASGNVYSMVEIRALPAITLDDLKGGA